MIILPAIDIIDGKPVRLYQGDYDKKEQYEAYEEYYDKILGDILNDMVYVIKDTKDLYSVKYKEEKFNTKILISGLFLMSTFMLFLLKYQDLLIQ